jgi:hypothetical protein
MDGVTDVPAAAQPEEIDNTRRDRASAEFWSALGGAIAVVAILLLNAATYGIAWSMNQESDLFDPLRIGITTLVVVALMLAVGAVVGIKTSDNAVPPPGGRRH